MGVSYGVASELRRRARLVCLGVRPTQSFRHSHVVHPRHWLGQRRLSPTVFSVPFTLDNYRL
jgi:hypothetical protein